MKKAVQAKQQGDTAEQVFHHEEKQSLRINKYLTGAGYCSRRGADKLVAEGRVRIDDTLASMGSQVTSGQRVYVDDAEVLQAERHVYIALNKPIGITCTLEDDIDGNILEYMDYPQRIFPIGRLDKDSSGLILLTSDGEIVNKILRAENNHEKEYLVAVDRPLTSSFIRRMSAGVRITNMRTRLFETTKKCRVEQLGSHRFKIILTQGLNRQIRRMCSALGYRVMTLKRVRIMNIHLGDLQVGQWRYVTQEELTVLNRDIGG